MINTHWQLELELHALLTSAINKSKWSPSCLDSTTPAQRALRI